MSKEEQNQNKKWYSSPRKYIQHIGSWFSRVYLRPSIASLIIPVFCFFIFLIIRSSMNLKTLLWFLLFIFAFLPTWLFLARILFPRIVVTIKDLENVGGVTKLALWADGREIYSYSKDNSEDKKNTTIPLPIQFSFQVWRKEKYDLCLKTVYNGDKKQSESFMEEANTFDHRVCHVVFEKRARSTETNIQDTADVIKEIKDLFQWLKNQLKN